MGILAAVLGVSVAGGYYAFTRKKSGSTDGDKPSDTEDTEASS
jgi:hypothetical protein